MRRLATVMTADDQASDSLDDVESAGDDVAESMEDVEAGSQEASESLIELDAAAAAASGTLIGLGAGLQQVFDNTRETRSELGRTAVTVGATRREMEDMTASLASTTFQTQEARMALSGLAEAGVQSEEDLREAALAMDSLSDATGASMQEIERLPGILMALDGDIQNLTENTDAFTLASQQTNIELRDLISTFERMDFQEMEEMGVDAQEAAAMIAMFGDETGYSGRVLRSEFNQAVDEADGDMEQLIENLGLSQDEFEEFNNEMASGTEWTEKYAEEANEAYTVTDRLRGIVDRATLQFAGYMEPVSALSPALFAAGSAGMFLSTVNVSRVIPSTAAATASHWANTAALTAKTTATRAVAAAQFLMTASTGQLLAVTSAKTAALWASVSGLTASTAASLSAASAKGVLAGAAGLAAAGVTALWTALGPLGLLALGLTAIILGLAGVMKTDLFGAGDQAASILGRIRGGAETLIAIFGELIGIGKELARIGLTAGVMALLAPFAAVLKLPDMLRSIGPRVANAAAEIPSHIIAGLDRLGPAQYALPVIGPLLLARDMVTDPSKWISAGRKIPSMIASGIRETASAPVDAVTDAVSGVRDRLPFSPAVAGPLQDLDQVGPALMKTITSGIREAAPEPVEAVEGAVSSVRDRLPFSPAVAGPLQDLDEVGPSLMGTIAGGVEGEASTLGSAMSSAIGKTPLGQAAGSAADAVGDAVGGGGGGPQIEVTVNQEIDASGEGSSTERLASSAQEIADLTIEEIVDALARETDFEPNGSPS